MSDTIYSRPGDTFYSELENTTTGLVGTIGVRVIRKSDQAEVIARTTAGIVESPAGSGRYQVSLTAPTQKGDYTVLWDTGTLSPETTAADDLYVTFNIPIPPSPSPIEDLRDTRVLIPRVRRGLEGAGVKSPTLEDDAVNAVIADAVANIILFTGGLFGHQLQVLARDETYSAPTAWLVDPVLSEAEGGLIVIQAQLDILFADLKAMKIQETIRDESSEWSYSLSANSLSELIKSLRAQRDKILEQIDASTAPLDAWVNTLYERDAWTDTAIEPYTLEAGGLGGQEFIDPRFG